MTVIIIIEYSEIWHNNITSQQLIDGNISSM